MARKRVTRREKGAGSYTYDKKTRRHEWTIEHKGERYRVRDRDEEKARHSFEALKRQLFGGVDVKGAHTPLKDYMEHYIDTEVSGKQSTRDDYHKRADLYIFPTFGDWPLTNIKRRHVVDWVGGMMNDPDPETGRFWARNSIKQALGLLRRCLATAVPEFLEYNPADGVRVPLRRKGDEYKIDDAPIQEKVFTPEQMEKFLAEVKRTNHLHGFYVYYVLMVDYAWRRGEGLGLRRKDVNFDEKTITIAQQVTRNPMTNEVRVTTPKTDSGKRVLPASDDALKLIREQIMLVGAQRPDDLLFPGRDGKQRQPNGVTQHMRRVCERLGFEGYNLHSLRKYAITDWRTEGVDLEVAAAMAGHKGIKVTAETYSQPTMERKRAAIDRKKKKG